MVKIIYFSTKSENTKRFIERLGFDSWRIPFLSNIINDKDDKDDKDDKENRNVVEWVEEGIAKKPFILVTPTYGGGHLKGAVPPQVIKFLNKEENRKLLKGVIACGDTNFGYGFCSAGKIISEKCNVPNIHNIEMFGTKEDVEKVKEKLIAFFKKIYNINPSIE